MDSERILASSQADNELVHQKLRRYNRQYMRDFQDFSYHIERDGRLIAGVAAASTFETVEVEFLFVEEAFRGRGLGRRLLEQVERAGRDAGMKYVLLNTYSFQAPDFYRKMGYTELYCVRPCLGPYAQYFFWKTL